MWPVRIFPFAPRIVAGRIFFAIVLWTGSTAAFAETLQQKAEQTLDSATEYEWQDKLKRGALNIISSPVEIGRSIYLGSRDENLAYGWTVGLIRGIGQGGIRLGAGVIDLVTFPFDFPKDGKAPLVEPEYVWEKPGVKYA